MVDRRGTSEAVESYEMASIAIHPRSEVQEGKETLTDKTKKDISVYLFSANHITHTMHLSHPEAKTSLPFSSQATYTYVPVPKSANRRM